MSGEVVDLLAALQRSVDAAKAECGAQYGSNPDRCYLPTSHGGKSHRNKWGTSWAAETEGEA